MARGRMLNNSICGSKKFHDLPDDTCRLLATWLISQLDVQGVFYGDPAMVKSYIFPRRDDITVEQVEGYLQALEASKLVVRFEANGDLWQYWPGFEHNQAGLRKDRENPQFPPPPMAEGSQQGAGKIPPGAGRVREDGGNSAGEMPAEEKGTEKKVNRKEKKGGGKSPPPPEPVRVFRENAHRYPAKSWYGDIVKIVGFAEADLIRWGEVVKAWVGLGWNPTNVKGMLDFFSRNEIPPGDRKVQAGSGLSAADEWLQTRQEAGLG